MRKVIWLLIVIGFIISCSKNEDNDSTFVEDMGMEINIPTESYSMGNFVSDAHETTGTALIDKNKSTLFFKDFKTDSGPRLLVYLATDGTVKDFVSLGDLKGINGNYSYTIPENTDLENYNRVDIWCIDFSVSFGHAILKIN